MKKYIIILTLIALQGCINVKHYNTHGDKRILKEKFRTQLSNSEYYDLLDNNMPEFITKKKDGGTILHYRYTKGRATPISYVPYISTFYGLFTWHKEYYSFKNHYYDLVFDKNNKFVDSEYFVSDKMKAIYPMYTGDSCSFKHAIGKTVRNTLNVNTGTKRCGQFF